MMMPTSMSATRAPEELIGRFPPGFLWGTATAAYQIEGAVAEGGRTPSIWDTFSHTPGATRDGDTGDVACDHYHRWPEDVALLAGLGGNAYRLSVAWPRLQPGGSGGLDPRGVAFYRNLLGAIREAGIRPFVTLYHWDLPQVLEDAGGWPSRETAVRFADFAGRVAEALGDLAEAWITLNEPWCSSFLGYGWGAHAPGRRNPADAVAAAHHLNLAHGLATRAIRQARTDATVGVSHILTDVHAASGSPADLAAARRFDANSNAFFLDPLQGDGYGEAAMAVHAPYGLERLVRPGDVELMAEPIDFLGVNHYHQVLVSDDPTEPFLAARAEQAEPATTSLGWSVVPRSLRNVLIRVADRLGSLPLYVTENGAAFDDRPLADGTVRDRARIDYLNGYLGAAAEAIEEGVNLRGYFAWSLLDNYEWAEGYRERFGLVFVDFLTQERTPKESYWWYRDLIRRHATSRDEPGTTAGRIPVDVTTNITPA